MLWEFFVYLSVEGIMLWGFWEGVCLRKNGFFVDLDKCVNVVGKCFIFVKEEWIIRFYGRVG